MPDPAHAAIAYRFGEFVLEPAQQRLIGADRQPVSLTPKAFDTLLCLVERSGDLVTKNELLTRVWPNVVVEEAILARNVADLRKALGDDSSAPRFIETLPKRGYRFVASVAIVAQGTTADDDPARPVVRIVDTLQLVSENPAPRALATTLDAPEFSRVRPGLARALPWLIAGLAIAAAVTWWLAR
jgi:DNA-binding winged helix-turn-helix (wHTH) protein